MFENGAWTEETTLPIEEPTEDVTEETIEATEDPAESDAKPAEEEPKYTVKYNGKELELPVSELIKNAQKGMNYDHVHGELEELRQTKAQLEAQAEAKEQLRRVLKLYGYDGTDEEVATTLAAQAQQITPEEYQRRQREEQERLNQAIESDPRYQQMIRADRERTLAVMEYQDLRDIKEHFPEVTAAKIDEIPNMDKFIEHRYNISPDGSFIPKMSAVEAYALANVLNKPQHRPNPETKDHLLSKTGNSGGSVLKEIPRNELGTWTDSFPGETIEQLTKRYNNYLKLGE